MTAIKYSFISMAILSLILMIAGSDEKKEKDNYNDMTMRTIAWNSIAEAERITVLHPVEQASVRSFGIEDVQNSQWIRKAFKTKEDTFVAVTFKTKDDGRLGPITIYIDPCNNKIVGRNVRM